MMTPRKFELLFALTVAVAVAAACDHRPTAYELQFVTIDRVETIEPDRLEVVYRTLPEAQFHSPGVCLERVNGELEMRVERAYYKLAGQSDVPASALEPYQRRVEIDLEDAHALVLVDEHSRKQIWPTGTHMQVARDR